MLLIGIGCIDLGRAVQHYGVMSNAASAGAQRAASVRLFPQHTSAAWEAKVRETVREELASLRNQGATLSAFDIRINAAFPPTSDAVTQKQTLPRLSVAVDYDFETTLHWPGLPRRIPLHCEAQIREYR
jgi:hypothetical protein